MLLNFFDLLRKEGVPVSFNEWLMLLKLLHAGAVEPDLSSFYHAARSVLVKDEAFYDRFDRAFAIAFKDAEPPSELVERIVAAMKKELARQLSEEEKKMLAALPFEQIMKNFVEQLQKGHYKAHEGGDKAIGRRGKSTQGADGFNPAGVRIGQSEGRNRRAVQVAEFRRFREYDRNKQLDTRGMRVAVARLKRMLPDGPPEELDLDKTIDKTARNGGEIELEFVPRKRNTQRILLLTDVGGSMSGYAELVSRFFSAMRGEVKNLTHYYFHNCVYEHLYEDAARYRTVPTHEVIEKHKKDYMLVMVGDAAMAPTELLHIGGAIDLFHQNMRSGLDYLQDLRMAFKKSIWLNPEPERLWETTQTIMMIRAIFPMFALTQDGIVAGVEHLLGRKKAA